MNAPVKLGQPLTRREDRRLLTGRGRYADNTAPAGALAVLFVRSARSARAEPFTIARQDLTGWTLTLAPDVDQLNSLLSITAK